MKIAIHQPNYIPWSGFFYKMAIVDCFVLLNNAQFTKNSYQNRVKIKTPQGAQWLTQPVRLADGSFKKTREITFADQNWREKHIKTLQANYSKSKYYNDYAHEIFGCIRCSSDLIVDVNEPLIRSLAKMIGIKTKIIFESDLGIDEQNTGTRRLLSIAKKLGADSYVHGIGGVSYHDYPSFEEEEIELVPTNFRHPTYSQCWGEFIEGLSVCDLLFNCGNDSLSILLNG